MELQMGFFQKSFSAQYSNWVSEALDELPDNFVITDPYIAGHPIVFASRGFLKMCGYSKEEVIGRNGRMFQGPRTSRKSVMEIREAIREERALQISLLNYRKDGTPFWMLFHLSPVFTKEDGRVVHFVAVQVPILRKAVHSGCVVGRNGVNLCEDWRLSHEILLGSCRREVCCDSMLELGRGLVLEPELNSRKGIDVDDFCEASEIEKQQASTAFNSILSVLTHYSHLTGRLVSGRRCCVRGTGLSSALLISLGRIKQSFVLLDPHTASMPIVYASDAFLELTGYTTHEVLGTSHKLLSGSDTDSSTLSEIDDSMESGKSCTVRILNYRKDRSSFWNMLHVSPVRNASGKIAYYVVVQMEDDGKNRDKDTLRPEFRLLGAVGAVKVAVRGLTMGPGPSSS